MQPDTNPEMFGDCKKCGDSIEFRLGAWRGPDDKSICGKGGHHGSSRYVADRTR